MELSEYILPIKKWWWLLVAATAVAGLTSFLVTQFQPPVYQAHTTLMVGQTINDPNPNSTDFYLVQSLAGAYADMANREPVRNATMQALGLTWLPDYSALVLPNSQLIEIQVTDSLPERAQRVAAELAKQLILRSPTSDPNASSSRQDFINSQLNSLQSQITSTEGDISTLQNELGGLTSAKQISDTQNQIAALQAKLSTLRGNYASLIANTQKGAINSLSIIEPAVVPGAPVNQSKMKTVMLASFIGLLLAALGAYGIEYFDRTLKTTAQVNKLLGVPVIGYIAEIREAGDKEFFFKNHPRSLTAEVFRSIRANINFASAEKPIRTLLITSIDAAAGKTTVATNLAYAFSGEGRSVILIDADLHRPRLNQVLGLPASPGLSDVLLDQTISEPKLYPLEGQANLQIITAGNHLDDPRESSVLRINTIFDRLAARADLIIIDGPPMMVSDAAVLASKVDAVLMVIRPGQTKIDVTEAALEQLRRSGVRIIGAVLNRISRHQSEAYGGNLYYSPYQSHYAYFKDEKPEKRQATKNLN